MLSYHYNLGSLFDEVVADHAVRPALVYDTHAYTFREIGIWVDSLAALLMAMDLQRGDVIAIGHNKKPLSYALMLAALRLGIAYVVIDVGSPVARTSGILDVCAAKVLFYDDSAYQSLMVQLAASRRCPILLLDEKTISTSAPGDLTEQHRLAKLVDGACIAYIMFTSGSTGVPKGVAVTHQNIMHLIAWGQERFGISNQDNFANLSPMYFDNSVFDFYVGLFSGACLTPVNRELLTSPYALASHVAKMACTIWFSVPSLLIYLMTMKALTDESLPSLRLIVFGGEGYPKVELRKLYKIFFAQAKLVNVYGPTECTCICSAHTLSDDDFTDMQGLPTLGHLNPNFDYRIVDEHDEDSPSGELCLIGPNVASGYFNDLERTEASFFTITTSRRYMKRMYRTGDLVREENGQLYFTGRKDNQIKHMGYRIELEEIEHALMKLPQINQAAVVYHRSRTAYGKLIGYVASLQALDEKIVLEDLARFVPEYMIPSRLIVLPELPKNPNGKVDRPALLGLLKT